MIAPNCPHGVRTLSPNHDFWVCPGQVLTCPSEPITNIDRANLNANLRQGRPAGYEGNGTRPTREATGKPGRVIPRPVNDYRRALRKCPDVKGSNLTVGLLMAEYADYGTGMDCFPAQATIAGELGFTTTRQVRTCLRWLGAVGWLHDTGTTVESDGPHRGSKIYWLTFPDCPHPHDGSALPVVKE